MPAARPACETKVSESSSGIDKAISIVQNRSYLEERERSDVELPNCSSLSKRNSRNAIVTAIETASYSLTLTATHPVSFVHSRPLVLPTDHSRPDPGWSGPNENRRRFSGNSATLGRRASCLLPWPTDRICRDTPTRRFPDPGDLGSCASCSGSQGWPWPRHWACHSSS